MESTSELIEHGRKKAKRDDFSVEEPYEQIGQLTMELVWSRNCRVLVARNDALWNWVTGVLACGGNVNCWAWHVHPIATAQETSDQDLHLMSLTDEQYLRTPSFSPRLMAQWFCRHLSEQINRKRVQHLIRYWASKRFSCER